MPCPLPGGIHLIASSTLQEKYGLLWQEICGFHELGSQEMVRGAIKEANHCLATGFYGTYI
jgi:hypothetical protein